MGMRIPKNIGAGGMEFIASWASSIGIDVIDVPYRETRRRPVN